MKNRQATRTLGGKWPCHILERGDVIGRGDHAYRITDYIGKGSFGVVYGAESLSSAKEVAVKIYAAELSADGLLQNINMRILREAEKMSRFRSPALPRFYYSGEHEGRNYYVMERLSRLGGKGYLGLPRDEKDVREFVLMLVDAVAALHKLRYAHCDIKPENIMQNSDGRIVLADFGAARKFDARGRAFDLVADDSTNVIVEMSGEVRRVRLATRGYAAPEQSDACTRAVDIFAVGNVIRDCFAKDVPLKWGAVINRCTSRDAKYRYKDVEELRRDVLNLDEFCQVEIRRNFKMWEVGRLKRIEAMIGMPTETMSWIRFRDTAARQYKESRLGRFRHSKHLIYFSFDSYNHGREDPVRSIRITTPVRLSPDDMLVIDGLGAVQADIAATRKPKKGEGLPRVALVNGVLLDNESRIKPKNAFIQWGVGESCAINFSRLKKGALDETKLIRCGGISRAFVCCGAKTLSPISNMIGSGLPVNHDKINRLLENQDYLDNLWWV